ncbi:upstream-binding factor 1-like protein 1 [Dasypus novemcinctus]|uniref:upstream-binding factor 1-like protein 1 n=1 Tax=Dasypus novemcinctus TaxID=9361 RepID=UPI000329177F|nr:upstream-binding factor 1-like protein 1 [Dasypus novemcinctus]
MALCKSQVNWSKEDTLMLLECMENNLPANDECNFKTTQFHLDWEKIAFKDFSGEMCKLKWLEFSHNLRKFRTLTELVLEAQELAKYPHKWKKHKKHPECSKKPLTSYIRFYKEKFSEYSQIHPELKQQELTKVLSKKYKELPVHIKMKYTEEFQKEKQEFNKKLARFREEHPELIRNSKKLGIPKTRQTPKSFQSKGKEMRSPPETNGFSKKMKFYGEPSKPPMNGYHKFHDDLWSSMELHHLSERERMVEIGRRWQRIPQGMKKQYEKLSENLQQQYKVELGLWLKSLSPREYAAYRESASAKRKNMAMMGGLSPKVRRTVLQSPPMRGPPEGHGEGQGLLSTGTDSSETIQVDYHSSQGSEDTKKEDGEDDDNSSSGDEDEKSESEGSGSSSSSSGDSSDLDCS